ncbi:hypothetical protein B0T14DRAFT_531451 [Immersiella caudata]|uniref:Protein-S-isoprenylcysteine O-methyltransferase n=1 Tax=Immersiella caudata TaxID=314043 RepID=A0AA39T204_9PEZI|nr:hypothetical protein B0T14DRAFT_531451 [Immersiella caudata]
MASQFQLPSLSQVSFATAILATAAACKIGLTPPHPPPPTAVKIDPNASSLHKFRQTTTKGTFNDLINAPIGFLALHTVGLALTYPNSPSWLLRHGANSLNQNLISWSASTAIPIVLILGVGLPLRVIPFRTLGKSFTFTLAPPQNGLVKTGIYKYLQHPSYTGAAVIFVAPMVLLYRREGALGCWIPEGWEVIGKAVERVVAPVYAGMLLWMLGMRVREEERMLKAEFGEEWEDYRRTRARFLPWIW